MKFTTVRGLTLGAAPFGGGLRHGLLVFQERVLGEVVTVINTQMPSGVLAWRLSPFGTTNKRRHSGPRIRAGRCIRSSLTQP